MHLQETQIDGQLIFEGNFINIHQDTVKLPNGKHSQRVWISHPGAACVLAITPEQQVVLVRQWRYATQQALLEVPAGKLDAGEDPAVCALRELAEETPYTAEKVEKLAQFYTAPGFCNEIMYVYRAINVSKNSQLNTDEDEFTETILLNIDETRKAIANGEIQDAKTLIALNFWLSEHL